MGVMGYLVERIPWAGLRDRLRLMRVDRPIGTWLVLWPPLWAMVAAARGWCGWQPLLIFGLGAFVMRSAGCVANDLADREIDPLVARTRERPLAAGALTPRQGVELLLLLLGGALGLALLLQPFTQLLAVGGAFLALSYPFTKRWVDFPQFYLGAAFGWGVIMAWADSTGTVALPAWLLFGATLTWAAGYDTIYAMMDITDDLKIGVNSTAIWFGRYALIAVAVLYLVTLGLLAAAGVVVGVGWFYYVVLAGVALQMVWQLRIARSRVTANLLRAFLSNSWVGMAIFAGWLGGWMVPEWW